MRKRAKSWPFYAWGGVAVLSLLLAVAGALAQPLGITACGTVDLSAGITGCLQNIKGSVYAASPDGSLVAVGGWNRQDIALLDARGKIVRTIPHNYTFSLAFSPDNSALAIGGGREVTLWSTGTNERLGTLSGHSRVVGALAYSPLGDLLASGGPDEGIVRIWKTADWTELAAFELSRPGARQLQFSPSGELLAAVLTDGTLIVWNSYRGTPQYSLGKDEFSFSQVHFSSDGALLAGVTHRGQVRLVDAQTGKYHRTLEGLQAAFSPNGKLLAAVRGSINLYRLNDGALLHALEENRYGIDEVAFSSDSTFIAAAGGYENTIRIWSTESGALQRTLEVPAERTTGVRFLYNSDTVLSQSRETVQIWQTSGGLTQNLQRILLIASSTGWGLLVLGTGIPRTFSRRVPLRWLAGVVVVGLSFIGWGYMWFAVADATNSVVLFFGSLFTLGWGLGQMARST